MTASTRRRFLRSSALSGLAAALPAGAWTGAGPADRSPEPRPASGEGRAPVTVRFRRAVEAGDLPTVRELLEAEPALLYFRDEAGISAFLLALGAGRPEVAGLLRERGLKLDAVEAAAAADWELLSAILDRAPAMVNVVQPSGLSPIHAAARFGHGDRIWVLEMYGGDADLNPAEGPGYTPTRIALEHPDLATAEATAYALIANSADPNAPQKGGDSLLHAAARRGSDYLVRTLIRKGADVGTRDAEGRTAEEVAREAASEAGGEARREEVLRLLREHRSIGRDHNSGKRAYDASGGRFEMPEVPALPRRLINQMVGHSHFRMDEASRLAERHPELLFAISTQDEMTVEACSHIGHAGLIAFFLDRGAPVGVSTSISAGRLDRARALLAEDPERIRERGAHDFFLGWYPAIGPAETSVEAAELLVEYGIDLAGEAKLGETALHWAAARGRTDLAAFWIERGADVNARTRHEGATPLDRALARDRAETAALLRDRGGREGAALGPSVLYS